MTKTQMADTIRRRYRISQRAALVAAKDRDTRNVDFHSGVMSVCLVLLDDLGYPLKGNPTRKVNP